MDDLTFSRKQQQ